MIPSSRKWPMKCNLIPSSRKWSMKCDLDKCHILTITKEKQPVIVNYTFNGQTLESVSNANYLGVELKKDLHRGLMFKQHLHRSTRSVLLSTETSEAVPLMFTPTATKTSSNRLRRMLPQSGIPINNRRPTVPRTYRGERCQAHQAGLRPYHQKYPRTCLQTGTPTTRRS